jgi:putative ubiquitin-RnfH superfamily antitoxin RatB of RatAB toxin-antitoxin module
MTKLPTITVDVVYATSETQTIETVRVARGATVAHAITASGLLERFGEIDLTRQGVGIYGVRARLTDKIAHGDRVEIYRRLFADPKESRRVRARKQRAAHSKRARGS